MTSAFDETARGGTQRLRCIRCEYDLYGNQSGTCPECGTPVSVPLRYAQPEFFTRAQDVLRRAGLLVDADVEVINNDVISVAYHASSKPVGVVRVPLVELERAYDVLEDAGLPTERSARPIQDISDPDCPFCGREVDPTGPAQCPACGGQFTWVDIREPEFDPTGKLCSQCGYDLTGNIAKRCPECGAPLPRDLDDLVAAATRDWSEPWAGGRGNVPPLLKQVIFAIVMASGIALLLIPIAIGTVLLEALAAASLPGLVAIAVILCASIFAGFHVLRAAIGMRQREKDGTQPSSSRENRNA